MKQRIKIAGIIGMAGIWLLSGCAGMQPWTDESATNEHLSTDIALESETESTSKTTQASTTECETEKFEITMNFVGDLLLATNEGQEYANSFHEVAEREAPEYFLANVRDRFQNDTITVGDCENVFSDNMSLGISDKGQLQAEEEYAAAVSSAEAAGEPIPEYSFRAYWFRSPARYAEILHTGGIDIVSIDNNHIRDYGTQGYEDTKAALDAAGVSWGEHGTVVYREIDGFRIAFVFGSMYGESAVSLLLSDLETAKENSDYQVVYFHGGTEGIHTPEDWKIRACHRLVEEGADLVVGDHPHVLQPMESYQDVTILYSLGNFVFGGNRHPENRTIIYNQTLTLEKNKKTGEVTLINVSETVIPCYVFVGDMNNWQPAVITDAEEKQRVLDFMNKTASTPY